MSSLAVTLSRATPAELAELLEIGDTPKHFDLNDLRVAMMNLAGHVARQEAELREIRKWSVNNTAYGIIPGR